jgi:hypothetical protein
MRKLIRKFMVFDVGQHTKRQKVRILAAAQAAPAPPTHQGGCPMSSASSFNDPAGRELLAMLRNARRNKFGDPKYHSGRKKKEFASPYLEFLDKLEKAARKMPQPYEFDLLHTDGIRHADLDAGVRVLNELIFECQRSLEGIEHARLDLEARSWARGQGLRE